MTNPARIFPIILILLMAVGVSLEAKAPAKRPNILHIFADDLSHRNVSSYREAYPWIRTPNIDRLAKSGVRFENAYVGTWCMPSRASMLTGHLQYGVESMRSTDPYPTAAYDPAVCRFWPAVFRENGYQTAQIGKWHLGSDTGYGRDWDYQEVWNYSSGRPQREASREYYYNQQIVTNGGAPHVVPGYSTDNYTRWANEYIRGANRDKDKPWYLWLCYTAPHSPYTPAKRHVDSYPAVSVPDPADIYPPRTGKPEYARIRDQWIKGPAGEPVPNRATPLPADVPVLHGDTLSAWSRQVAQTVQSLDDAVGELLKILEETNQLENTLVVFAGDQGYAWGQHGFDTKVAPYDANLRTPLIVSMPGTVPQGEVSATPVNGVDLVPTFFRYAGIKLPWKMHGHDLSPLLKNPKAAWDHPVLMAYTAEFYGSDTNEYRISKEPLRTYVGIPWWVFVVKDRFKYISSITDGLNEELYDLHNDPDELINLAGESRYATKAKDLRALMIRELRRTDAGIVNHLPEPRAR